MKKRQPRDARVSLRGGAWRMAAVLLLLGCLAQPGMQAGAAVEPAAVAVAAPATVSELSRPSDLQAIGIAAGGLDRRALLHVPPGAPPVAGWPLVIMLHGYGGNAQQVAQETGWAAKADREGFAVVFPEAARAEPGQPPGLRRNPQAWNDGSGRFFVAERQIDDVAFIGALIDRLADAHRVDRRRVYVTGFSNGASMAFRVGVELAGRVAAVAPVAGSLWVPPTAAVRAVPLCYITGTADPLNPLDGGPPRLGAGGAAQGGRDKPAVAAMLALWAAAAGLPVGPAVDQTAGGVRQRRWASSAPAAAQPAAEPAALWLVTIDGQGHVWPGAPANLPQRLVGPATRQLQATDFIWDFFRTQRLSR